MAEIPLVVVNVQRGGPSTGQPTKVEQGDLLTVMFGSHGDAPKVVFAAEHDRRLLLLDDHGATIAETFNMVVVVLSDASLATAQQPFPRPQFDADWLAPPIDQNPVPEGAKPYDWDPVTGQRAASCPASRTACTRSPASRTTARAASPTIPRSTSRACARAA